MATREMTLAGVPVLVYQGITAAPHKHLVQAPTFRQHLVQIRMVESRVVGLGDLWSGGQGGCASESSVVLSFDDDRAACYEVAFPLLVRARARAEFFINTASVGRQGHLTWEQVHEMQQAGMSFQSSARMALVGLPPRLLDHELRTAKRGLEDRLGRAVEFLAAPYGLLDRHVVAAALEAGYRAVCNSSGWPARPGSDTVDRVVVDDHTSEAQFAALLLHRAAGYLPSVARTALGQLPKRVLLKMRPHRFAAEHPAESA